MSNDLDMTEDFQRMIDSNNARIDAKQRDICMLLEDIDKLKAHNAALDAFLKDKLPQTVVVQASKGGVAVG